MMIYAVEFRNICVKAIRINQNEFLMNNIHSQSNPFLVEKKIMTFFCCDDGTSVLNWIKLCIFLFKFVGLDQCLSCTRYVDKTICFYKIE